MFGQRVSELYIEKYHKHILYRFIQKTSKSYRFTYAQKLHLLDEISHQTATNRTQATVTVKYITQ